MLEPRYPVCCSIDWRLSLRHLDTVVGSRSPSPGPLPRGEGARPASELAGCSLPRLKRCRTRRRRWIIPVAASEGWGEGGPLLINHDEKMHPLSLRPLPGLWPCEQLGPLNSASLFFSSLHFICYAGVPMVDLKSGASVWAWLAAWMPVKPEVKGMKYGEFAKGN